MPVDAFLKFEEIDGESTDEDHRLWIDVLSFSWAVHNTASPVGGGGGTGKATAEDFSFSHLVDKASPALMLACATGRHLREATLAVRKAGGAKGDYLTIKMSECVITTVAPGFSKEMGDLPVESCSLNFSAIEETVVGNEGETVKTSFNFAKV